MPPRRQVDNDGVEIAPGDTVIELRDGVPYIYTAPEDEEEELGQERKDAAFEQLHPRDKNGRFAHVGAMVKLPSGAIAKVGRVLDGGKLEVEHEGGKRMTVDAAKVEVQQEAQVPTETENATLAPKDGGGSVASYFKAKNQRKKPDVGHVATNEKRLTRQQALSAASQIAKDVAHTFDAKPLPIEVRRNDELPVEARYKDGKIIIRERVLDEIRDRDTGVDELRKISHEAVHGALGGDTLVLGRTSKALEEGGAEILSVAHWHARGPEYGKRDAIMRDGSFVAGPAALAGTSVYKDEVAETMRRAASVVGWDRSAILRKVEEVLRSDHYGRISFRNSSDPAFRPPGGVKADAESLLNWLLSDPESPGAPAK